MPSFFYYDLTPRLSIHYELLLSEKSRYGQFYEMWKTSSVQQYNWIKLTVRLNLI
jgi:hypothetical protein